MVEKILELVQKQNQCISNEYEHTLKESPLGKSCEEVVIEVLSPNLERIDPVIYASLESIPARLSCLPPSPSLEYSLVKPIGDYVITDPTNDLGLVDIEKEQLEGRSNEFDKSLRNYRGYNLSLIHI